MFNFKIYKFISNNQNKNTLSGSKASWLHMGHLDYKFVNRF